MKVIHATYTLDAWRDPWGGKVPAYVVDTEMDLMPVPGETYKYHNGYNWERGQVYDNAEGQRYFGYAPIDFHGHTMYTPIDHPGANLEQPSTTGRYVVNKRPVRWSGSEWIQPLEEQ